MNLSANSVRTNSLFVIVAALLLCVACSRGPASDAILGEWKSNGDTSSYEFLSDGTVILVTTGATQITGKWVRLEDDRVKVDLTQSGSTISQLWRVTIKGDVMDVVDKYNSKFSSTRQKK